MRALCALLLLGVLYVTVDATIFVSVDVYSEGPIPVIAAAAGCLMKLHRQPGLFMYETAGDATVKAEIVKDIQHSHGVVVLQGHGSPFGLAGCKPDSATTYADFLAQFQSAIGVHGLTAVYSYGCETGQGFVGELKTALVGKGFKGFEVFGPAEILVVNCPASPDDGQPKFARIMADSSKRAALFSAWGTVMTAWMKKFDATTNKELGTKCASVVKSHSNIEATQTSIALSNAFTPLWQEFLVEADKQSTLFAVGQGWVASGKVAAFRQLFKTQRAQRRHPLEP